MNYNFQKKLIERQHSWVLVFEKICISINAYGIKVINTAKKLNPLCNIFYLLMD